MTLAERVAELVEQHGSLRAAARAIQVDAGYLLRLGNGEKVNPGKPIMRRIGLKRVVEVDYQRIKP